MKKSLSITLCMGSSCFARGNGVSLEVLERLIEDRNLQGEVELRGSRCEGCCTEGPNLRIGDRLYHRVAAEDLERILDEVLNGKDGL